MSGARGAAWCAPGYRRTHGTADELASGDRIAAEGAEVLAALCITVEG